MKNIELPRKVLVGDDAVYEVDEVACELGLTGKPLIICDEITKGIAGDIVAEELDKQATVIADFCASELRCIHAAVRDDDVQYVVGVGGGRILDGGKVVAFENRIPFISVPTAASHDGIASPQASLKTDKPVSVQVHCPLGVIADTSIISKAPKRLLAAGCGDAISNYTAVLDWQLAHEEKKEYFGDYASALSSMSAEIVMKNSDKSLREHQHTHRSAHIERRRNRHSRQLKALQRLRTPVQPHPRPHMRKARPPRGAMRRRNHHHGIPPRRGMEEGQNSPQKMRSPDHRRRAEDTRGEDNRGADARPHRKGQVHDTKARPHGEKSQAGRRSHGSNLNL
jgi:hypothetical protein